MSTAPTNSLIAHYFLGNCLVGTSNFVSGEIAFFDSLVNFVARDTAGNCTAVLPFDYLTLISFRIVKPKCRIRLELPIGFISEWAETSGFGAECSQGDESIVLNLHFTEEDMAHFLAETAPILAQNHARARSASRMSLPDVMSNPSIPPSHLPEQSVPTRASRTLPPASQSQQEQITDGDDGMSHVEDVNLQNNDDDNNDAYPEDAATQSQEEEGDISLNAAGGEDAPESDIGISNPSSSVVQHQSIDDVETQDSNPLLRSDSEEIPSLTSHNLTTTSNNNNIVKTVNHPAFDRNNTVYHDSSVKQSDYSKNSLIDACKSPETGTLSRKFVDKKDSNVNEVSQLSEPTQHRDDDDSVTAPYIDKNIATIPKTRGRKKQIKRLRSLSPVTSNLSKGKAVVVQHPPSDTKANVIEEKCSANDNKCNDDDDDDYIFDMESIGIDSNKLFFGSKNATSNSNKVNPNNNNKMDPSSSSYFPHFKGLFPPPAKKPSRRDVTQKSLTRKGTVPMGKTSRSKSNKLSVAPNYPYNTKSISITATNNVHRPSISHVNVDDANDTSKDDVNDNIDHNTEKDSKYVKSGNNEISKSHLKIHNELSPERENKVPVPPKEQGEEPKTETKPLKQVRRRKSKSAPYIVPAQLHESTSCCQNKKITTDLSSLSPSEVTHYISELVDKDISDRINEEALTAMLTSGELEENDNSLDDFLVRAQLLVKKKRAEKVIRAASMAAESVRKGSGKHITVETAERALKGYFSVNEGHRGDLFAYHSRRFSQLYEMTTTVKVMQANIIKTFTAEMGELSKCIDALDVSAGKLVEKLKKDEARWITVDEVDRANAVSALQN